MDEMRVIMFSKTKNLFCDYAEAILLSSFPKGQALSVRGNPGEPMDESLCWYSPDYVISFVSPWILPLTILRRAKKAAINFHPGSPDYPGTGCYNFALYEEAEMYGVTVHHMEEKVDSGALIMTSYFPIAPYETVETLKLKSMNHLLFCFEQVISCIVQDQSLPVSDEKWRRKPFTRRQMLDLFEVPAQADRTEVIKRVRAAQFPSKSGAYVTVGGERFYYPEEARKPVVE